MLRQKRKVYIGKIFRYIQRGEVIMAENDAINDSGVNLGYVGVDVVRPTEAQREYPVSLGVSGIGAITGSVQIYEKPGKRIVTLHAAQAIAQQLDTDLSQVANSAGYEGRVGANLYAPQISFPRPTVALAGEPIVDLDSREFQSYVRSVPEILAAAIAKDRKR
jgi:hypothetical protein